MYLKEKKINYFSSIIIALVIFNSGGVGVIPNYIITILIFLLLAVLFFMKKRDYYLIIILSVSFLIILLGNYYYTSSGEDPKSYIILYSYIITATLIVTIYNYNQNSLQFILDLKRALIFFLFHAFFSFFGQFFVENYTPIYGRHIQTFNYILYYQDLQVIPYFLRNQGLFWEPGVLQFYMNLLFFISYFIFNDRKISFLALFVIITTFSTTGYLLISIQLFYIAVSNMKKNFLAFPLLLILVTVILPVLLANINDKFFGYNRRSSLVRKLDFAIGMDIIKNNPIVGIGLTNEKYLYTHYYYGENTRSLFGIAEVELYNKGTTNSILWLASSLGLPIFFLWMYALFNQQVILQKKNLLFLLILTTLLSEPLINTPFFIILIASGFSRLFFNHEGHFFFRKNKRAPAESWWHQNRRTEPPTERECS